MRLTLPYAPFAGLIPRLEAEQTLDETGIALLHEFTDRTTPALRQEPSDRGESGKLQLMMTVTQAATNLASHTPVLLLVDDLHLADPSSLDLFAYLAFFMAEQRTAPLLLLGSYRPVPSESRLGRLLNHLGHEAIVREVELPGIDEAETRALLQGLGVIRPTQQLVCAVQEATHGIPLFVEEMMPHLIQSGALYARRGYLATRRGAVDTLQLPPNIADAIAVRIQALPQA